MAVIRNTSLEAFQRVRSEGALVIADFGQCALNIGLINIMPDAALSATERQFIRLLALCRETIRFYPFTLDGIQRSAAGKIHIDNYYFDLNAFVNFRTYSNHPTNDLDDANSNDRSSGDRSSDDKGLDALIISGANVPSGTINQAPFWQELCHIFDFINQHQIPTLFTCLATHAAMDFFFNKQRQPLQQKCWGVYEHGIVNANHCLTRNIVNHPAETINIIHSRFNEISAQQFTQAGLQVLIESEQAGVHLAVCEHKPFTFLQGHPEYDHNSLLKEFIREVSLFLCGQRADYPEVPYNYFNATALAWLDRFKVQVLAMPEQKRLNQGNHYIQQLKHQPLISKLDNSWMKVGTRMIQNWLKTLSAT